MPALDSMNLIWRKNCSACRSGRPARFLGGLFTIFLKLHRADIGERGMQARRIVTLPQVHQGRASVLTPCKKLPIHAGAPEPPTDFRGVGSTSRQVFDASTASMTISTSTSAAKRRFHLRRVVFDSEDKSK